MTVGRVRLDGLSQAALIILQPSGVAYETQVGGTWCRQETAEGVLVPVDNNAPFDVPYLALRAQLDKLLFEVAALDDARLGESCEAWVYVEVLETEYSSSRGFGDSKGVLTWPNSD